LFSSQTPPTPDEIGHCDVVRQDEIGDRSVVIFEHASPEGSKVCTLVLRASTDNVMDDLERAVDDAVNNFKVLTRVRGVFVVVGMLKTTCFWWSAMALWPVTTGQQCPVTIYQRWANYGSPT